MLLGLAGLPALAQAPQRAAAAAARGDLRTAQIEWRNAVRQDPASTASRIALALVSLELADGETAEREVRAALLQGWDPAIGNAALVRAFLVNGRYSELLEGVPQPPSDPGAQVAAGRAMAHLALNQRALARDAVQLALRLAPDGAQAQLAASALALAEGDRAAAEAAVDRVLSRDPAMVEALIRKGTLAFDRRDPREAVAYLTRAIDLTPGHVYALLRRAEILMALNEPQGTRRDLDAALAVQPNSAAAHYLRAMLASQALDWAAADRSLQRVGGLISSFPDGFLLLASVKRGLGQNEQAMDAARRHAARWPNDARGARLSAVLDLEANRPQDALAALAQLAARGGADAGSLDMLGRLLSVAGRRQESAAAFQAASALAPDDAGLMARLAASRLAVGEMAGAVQAANLALRLDPNLNGAQELLAFAALYRGDLPAVAAALEQLRPEARRSEAVGVLIASTHMMRLDLDQAKSSFHNVIREHAGTLAARLGLARVELIDGNLPAVARLLGEVLRLDPGNAEALGQLTGAALPPSPHAGQARAVLQAAQAAAPDHPGLALALAHVLVRSGQGARAAEILSAGVLVRQTSTTFALARAEAHASAGNWAEAETAARVALAETPNSVQARRQLAVLLARAGDARGAENLLQQGLRERPADPLLLQSLLAVIRDARGLDAALEAAGRLGREPNAQPAGAALRGDLLAMAQRPADAARSYATAQEASPTSLLALRLAAAWRSAGQPGQAAAALRAWLQREPNDDAAMLMLANLDIEADRLPEAEQRLEAILARQPDDPVVLNNLAWLLAQHEGEAATLRARSLAERAYFLAPNAEIADTLGWILARNGHPARALPLLRQSAQARGSTRPDPGAAYRFAYALNATGAREEALAVLTPALDASPPPFAQQAEATRLLIDLRGRR